MSNRRYRPYPTYNDSAVEWLGRLPEKWSVSRLKYTVDESRQITYGIVQAGPNIQNGVPYIRPADMSDENGVLNFPGLLRTSPQIAANYERSKITIGDIVCSIGPSFGKVMITPDVLDGANLTQGTARIAVSEKQSSRYFFWVLRSSPSFQQWESSVGGATFRALNLGPLAETAVPLPPLPDQTQIAKFLDHETAKIDRLIEKQEALIRLLKEKRQATISHAVTKGLNPHAPLKDSGVEWLGQVPAHWAVARIKNLAELISKGTTPSTIGADFVDEGVRFLKAENIGKSLHVEQNPEFFITPRVDAMISRSRLRSYDVLVIIAGATTGLSSIISPDFLPANTNQAVSFVRLKVPAHARFVARWLSSEFAQRTIWLGAVQAAQPNLSMEDLGNLPILIPPNEELAQVMVFIEAELCRFEELVTKAKEAASLLHERRTALISAAVTGKIDVRHWQPPSSSAIN